MSQRILPGKQAGSNLLAGQAVAFTGRLASMTRRAAAELVERHGGRPTGQVNRETTLLVVGQERWPLAEDGRLSHKLRRAAHLQRDGAQLAVIDEAQFVHRLGVVDEAQQSRKYSLAELAEMLRVPGRRLRHWVRLGLVAPAEQRDGIDWFDFRQVAGAKALAGLIERGIKPSRIRRSLKQWSQISGAGDQPAAASALFEEGGRLLWRTGRHGRAESGGQLQLEFSAAEPALVALPAEQPVDWFEVGWKAEREGRLEEAATAYRQALLQVGADCDTVFNLANVLCALGQPERAAERYWQVVEMQPTSAEAWNNLGICLTTIGQPRDARRAFEQALSLDPQLADAHYNLADLLDELGLSAQAAAHWRAYLAHDGTTAWAQYARSRLGAPG